MMLAFQWDSLRRGDHVLVHDAATADLTLRPGTVEMVDGGRRHRDVAVRYTDRSDAGRVVRPGRFATHIAPLADTAECWRCRDAASG